MKKSHHGRSTSSVVLAKDQGNTNIFPSTEKVIIIETVMRTEL